MEATLPQDRWRAQAIDHAGFYRRSSSTGVSRSSSCASTERSGAVARPFAVASVRRGFVAQDPGKTLSDLIYRYVDLVAGVGPYLNKHLRIMLLPLLNLPFPFHTFTGNPLQSHNLMESGGCPKTLSVATRNRLRYAS